MVIHEHHTAPYTHWHWYETSCHGRRATENGLPDVRLLSKPAAWEFRIKPAECLVMEGEQQRMAFQMSGCCRSQQLG